MPATFTPGPYTLQDEFTTNRAAGSVNGTPSDGSGTTRTVLTDTGNKISISGGLLTLAGNADSPHIIWSALARTAGRIIINESTHTASCNGAIGFRPDTTSNTSFENSFYVANTTTLYTREIATVLSIATVAASTSYLYAIALRASGAFYFIKGGVFANWTLLYVSTNRNNATLYPCACYMNTIGSRTLDYLRVPSALWLPSPLISDGFGARFDASDGLGHAEPTGLGSGGNGVTWIQQAGTWVVSTGKAVASALAGGLAIATVTPSTANVLIDTKLTRSAGNVGGVARYTDSSNHLRFYHDGTNAKLDQIVGGVTTTLITAAQTFVANTAIRLVLNGTSARLYYNNALSGTTSSINTGLTNAACGLYTTDTANMLDDFVVYATGTGGEYNSVLNNIGVLATDGTLASSGTLLNQANRLLGGAVGMSGALTKQSQKTLTAALTSAGSIIRQTRKLLTATIASSGLLSSARATFKLLTGAINSAGNVVKQTRRLMIGALTLSGLLIASIKGKRVPGRSSRLMGIFKTDRDIGGSV